LSTRLPFLATPWNSASRVSGCRLPSRLASIRRLPARPMGPCRQDSAAPPSHATAITVKASSLPKRRIGLSWPDDLVRSHYRPEKKLPTSSGQKDRTVYITSQVIPAEH
jgi:hypothetical protein